MYTTSIAWAPSLGISLSVLLDDLSVLFSVLIVGIGALIVLYAREYFHEVRDFKRLLFPLIFFGASMLGVVLAGNLIALFVFWELTSIASFLLIGFNHDKAAARGAALQALLVTSIGGLALLAGFVLIGRVAGTFEISELLHSGSVLKNHPLYPAIVTLIFIGAFTKSAQMPFHFWLPNAMEAPSPVSAYLHSATMVKAGVYVLLRLAPILGGTTLWFYGLTGVGAITMIAAALIAMRQSDLKRVLAYSTVSALGIFVFLA
jgi:multicomponent Na+:H+ antiporter subunit A